MENISTFLEDNNGGFSATRLAFLLWVVGLLVIWLLAFFKTGAMPEIPTSVLTLLGILMGGKVVQRFGENASPAPLAVAGTGITVPQIAEA